MEENLADRLQLVRLIEIAENLQAVLRGLLSDRENLKLLAPVERERNRRELLRSESAALAFFAETKLIYVPGRILF